MPDLFTKTRADAPPDSYAVEAAGLCWLAEATPRGGVSVPAVQEVTAERLVLPYVHQSAPTVSAAEAFGRALAITHRSGAPHHGSPPAGWSGDGFIATLPLPHVTTPEHGGWGRFYAEHRVAPFARRAGLDVEDRKVLHRLADRLVAEDEDVVGPAEPVARLHGDLWSGNVLWTTSGAVLVDPAAHGGHRETDLAMLSLFGLPHLDRVLAAYDEAFPLAPGRRDRVALHQVHPLLVHAVLFGGSYRRQAVDAARQYV